MTQTHPTAPETSSGIRREGEALGRGHESSLLAMHISVHMPGAVAKSVPAMTDLMVSSAQRAVDRPGNATAGLADEQARRTGDPENRAVGQTAKSDGQTRETKTERLT